MLGLRSGALTISDFLKIVGFQVVAAFLVALPAASKEPTTDCFDDKTPWFNVTVVTQAVDESVDLAKPIQDLEKHLVAAAGIRHYTPPPLRRACHGDWVEILRPDIEAGIANAGLSTEDLTLLARADAIIGMPMRGVADHPVDAALAQVAQNPPMGLYIDGVLYFCDEDSRTLAGQANQAHELFHHIQDQRLREKTGKGIADWRNAAPRTNDDARLAREGLIEGEARLLELEYVAAFNPQMAQGGEYNTMVLGSGLAPGSSAETGVYGLGLAFWRTGVNGNSVYENPPASTEWLLHPEKYGVDAPVEISSRKMRSAVPNGWDVKYENTRGEWKTRMLLKTRLMPNYSAAMATEIVGAAAGWGGDRYMVMRKPNGDPAEAWFTTWDTPQDAQEFARSLGQYSANIGHTEHRVTTDGNNVIWVVGASDAESSAITRDLIDAKPAG